MRMRMKMRTRWREIEKVCVYREREEKEGK